MRPIRGVAWFFRLGTHRKHKENERRRREALGSLGACSPRKFFFLGLENAIAEVFHKSKHEKMLTIQYLGCVYFMASFDTTDISYNAAWDQAPW